MKCPEFEARKSGHFIFERSELGRHAHASRSIHIRSVDLRDSLFFFVGNRRKDARRFQKTRDSRSRLIVVGNLVLVESFLFSRVARPRSVLMRSSD